jgi:hypothetical protein
MNVSRFVTVGETRCRRRDCCTARIELSITDAMAQ